MAIEAPQPIRSEFDKHLKKFKERNAALSKLDQDKSRARDRTVDDVELLYTLLERDDALIATMTALDKLLVFLDFLEQQKPRSPTQKTTRSPV